MTIRNLKLKPNLSPVMLAAIAYAKAHDRKLQRSPGGFWSDGKTNSIIGHRDEWYSLGTVQALVARGFAKYSAFKTNQIGQFPIEVTLTEIVKLL